MNPIPGVPATENDAFPPFPRRGVLGNFADSAAIVNLAQARLLDILNFLNLFPPPGDAPAGRHTNGKCQPVNIIAFRHRQLRQWRRGQSAA